jgi:hypothetical protein
VATSSFKLRTEAPNRKQYITIEPKHQFTKRMPVK